LILRTNATHPKSTIELITQRSKIQILPPQPFSFNQLSVSRQSHCQFANRRENPKTTTTVFAGVYLHHLLAIALKAPNPRASSTTRQRGQNRVIAESLRTMFPGAGLLAQSQFPGKEAARGRSRASAKVSGSQSQPGCVRRGHGYAWWVRWRCRVTRLRQ
jgi:hypothetical protein